MQTKNVLEIVGYPVTVYFKPRLTLVVERLNGAEEREGILLSLEKHFDLHLKIDGTGILKTAAKTIALKPHVPMIKFRKGAGGHSTTAPAQAVPPVAAAQVNIAAPQPIGAKAKPNATVPRPVIESWELPPHLRRKPLTPEEVEYINRGGPA
ncbi:unnamed protein product [Allacma fusca]|uniref:28S ribosomal protein S36, mitochondrial n=1 Tax=Allacma fusca TaxID=39272 RepID=A0A8J2PCT1_9HEXA|nr:unnamed protein product [Allacma fusca]